MTNSQSSFFPEQFISNVAKILGSVNLESSRRSSLGLARAEFLLKSERESVGEGEGRGG